MAARTPRGGRGSNQYATKGVSQQQVADFQSRMDAEAAAWAFTGDADDPDARKAGRVRDSAKQARWATAPDPATRKRLASSFNAAPEALVVLAEDSDPDVQRAAIANPNFPIDRLIEIARSGPEASSLQAAAAVMNPRLPEPVLREVAIPSPWSAARNPACPPDVLTWLASRDMLDNTATFTLRAAVAENLNTPPEVLAELCSGRFRVGDRFDQVAPAVARNPNTPQQTLASLYDEDDPRIRSRLAQNPSSPTKMFNRFVNDPDISVRRAAAANRSCPPADLEEFARWDSSATVAATAIRNPNLPVKFVEGMLARDNSHRRLHQTTRAAVERRVARHGSDS